MISIKLKKRKEKAPASYGNRCGWAKKEGGGMAGWLAGWWDGWMRWMDELVGWMAGLVGWAGMTVKKIEIK